MDKKKFSCYYSKIESDEDLRKFLEENKNKIPKCVKVERASRSSINETIPEDEIVIHASTFKLGLCLPFHALIEEILSKHHLVPTQLAPNCWRVMFGIIALNQICKIKLGWNEFCHCYAVKKNPGGAYYFSHKKSNAILVTGLPKSEKGWTLDDLIRLKGDCLVPRSKTAADHKPKGFKSSDVNKCDIDKALEFPNRDWKDLVDHAANLELHRESKIADESQSSLLTATGSAFSNLGGDVRSVEVVGLTTADVLSSPPSSCKKQKLMHCDSNASLAANWVPPYPARSDYESSIPSEAAAANSKVTSDNVNHKQGSEDQETVDQYNKNVNSTDQVLKHKLFEEACPLEAQSILKLVDFCMNHIKDHIEDRDRCIEELKAAHERKDKERVRCIEEFKAAYERKDEEFEEFKLLKEKTADRERCIEELKAAYERKDNEFEKFKLLKKEEAADRDRCIEELKAAHERKDKELEELKLLKKEKAAYKKIEKKIEKKMGKRIEKKMDKMYATRMEANKPRLPSRMESPSSSSSKNAGHLSSQSQNNHNIEGAADGVTPPNTGLNLVTSPNRQNIDIPGNDDINDQQQQQQQIIEPSSSNNGSSFFHSLLDQPILSDNTLEFFLIVDDPQQQFIEPSSSNNCSQPIFGDNNSVYYPAFQDFIDVGRHTWDFSSQLK